MAAHPADRVHLANEALKGVIELLVMVNQNDLHIVQPAHLCALLELLSAEFERAEGEFDKLAA